MIVSVGFFYSCSIVYSITVLFLIFVSNAILLFRQLLKRIEDYVNRPSEYSLEIWKKNYILICQLVAEMNRFFGAFLLISLCNGFFSVITYLFKILYPIGDEKMKTIYIFTFSSYLVIEVIQLFLIMYSSSLLLVEVG